MITINISLALRLCAAIVKHTVEYYVTTGSHAFACFVEFTKAFDKVNYWKLFNQLHCNDDGVSVNLVQLLAFWYSHTLDKYQS